MLKRSTKRRVDIEFSFPVWVSFLPGRVPSHSEPSLPVSRLIGRTASRKSESVCLDFLCEESVGKFVVSSVGFVATGPFGFPSPF